MGRHEIQIQLGREPHFIPLLPSLRCPLHFFLLTPLQPFSSQAPPPT